MSRLSFRSAWLSTASFLLLGSAALAADPAPPAAAPAPTQPMVIYDTALAPGWDNWSWAKTELSVELGGSPRRPIRAVAGAWQAVFLHHAPFSTTGLKRFSFLIQGSVPDREVRVYALIDGKTVGEGKLVKFSNTGWTDVKIPLATLGVEDTTIDGFWIQNASEVEIPKFFITDIKLD